MSLGQAGHSNTAQSESNPENGTAPNNYNPFYWDYWGERYESN